MGMDGLDLGLGSSGKVCGMGGLMKLRGTCGDHREEERWFTARNREVILTLALLLLLWLLYCYCYYHHNHNYEWW